MSNAAHHIMSKPSVAELEARLASNAKQASAREDRINSCEVESTDCALSMWADSTHTGLLRSQLELAQNDWKRDFLVLYRNGVRVQGKEVLAKFGYKSAYRWVINGEWFPSYNRVEDMTPRKLKNFQGHGFSWVKESLPSHVAQHFGNFIGAPVHSFVTPDEKDIITRPIDY